MTSSRPVATFAFSDRWMQEMILEASPPEFDVGFLEDRNDRRQVRTLLGKADFLVTVELPGEWVPQMTRCRLVQLQGVGYDAVDTAALAAAGIPLAQTPDGTTDGVAEHTLLLILALYKRLTEVHESVRQGSFDSVGWRSGCHFLRGKTLGIVGFGRIGRRVAHLARAFEPETVYCDPVPGPAEVERALQARRVSLDRLLEEADIVSVHTPLTPETRGLFGTEAFSRMKSGALFINTSRGATYDMDALYEALRMRRLGGAGLDVFNPQPPPPGHPLLQLPHVICTPHMATGTVEAHLAKARAQFANFRRVLAGEAPLNLVAPELTATNDRRTCRLRAASR